MKKGKLLKSTGIIALAALITMTGCGKTQKDANNKTSDKSEVLTLDFFSGPGNFMGKQEGWYAKLIKDKFNIELNIISPNVAGGGDSLYQTRSAAGDLGDIIVVSREKFRDCVKSGLIADISDQVEEAEYLKKFDKGINGLKEYLETDKVYGVPTWCSTRDSSEPDIAGVDPLDASYLRFDVFSDIGAPELKTYEDLLDALKKMQEKYPTTESGAKTYGFSFFKDWDGGYMKMANCLLNQLGYNMDNTGFYIKNGDASQVYEATDKDGPYYRALQILFKANQMGLVDPDSSSQTWDDYTAKVKDGSVLYAPWYWASVTHYNTPEKENNGVGYAFVPIDEANYYVEGCNPYGSDGNVLGIGSKADDIDRVFEFVDWYSSPENTYGYEGGLGPQGYLWDIKDGKPVPTEEGEKYLADPFNFMASEEIGGGQFDKGRMMTNATIQSTRDIDPATGESFVYDGWSSVIEGKRTKLDDEWTERYGSKNAKEYLVENDKFEVSPGALMKTVQDPSDIATTRASVQETLINSSWKMVFANNEEEFNKLWDEMVEEMKGLGYDKCLEFDKQNLDIFKDAKSKAEE